jgi:hypothetical protein
LTSLPLRHALKKFRRTDTNYPGDLFYGVQGDVHLAGFDTAHIGLVIAHADAQLFLLNTCRLALFRHYAAEFLLKSHKAKGAGFRVNFPCITVQNHILWHWDAVREYHAMENYSFLADLLSTFRSSSDLVKVVWLLSTALFVAALIIAARAVSTPPPK